jgi:hypothetical protein
MLLKKMFLTAVVQLITLTVVTTVFARTWTQDSDISVNPVTHCFPVTAIGADSISKTFYITNHNATSVMTIGTISLAAPNADQFSIVGGESCSGATLVANGGSCQVTVVHSPNRAGSMSATLLIPSSAPDTPTLTAFMTTAEDVADQAIRRMPPVLSAVAIPATITSGASTTISLSLLGYDSSYQTEMVLFDCTGISNGNCGDSYGDSTMKYDSGVLIPDSNSAGAWTFNGVTSRLFTYSHTFTAPTAATATDFVIRFYNRSQRDIDAANGGLSLLIPGNLPGITYYDTAGRRIVKQITPP